MCMLKILEKVFRICDRFKNKLIFKSFGNRSNIFKPLFIVGAKYIEIGKKANINPGLRIEAIDEWNGN